MVICFDATIEGKQALDSLLATGQFRDTSEAVSVSLVNYATICKALTEGGQSAVDSLFRRPGGKGHSEYNASSIQIRDPLKEGIKKPTLRIPEIFVLKSSNTNGLLLQPIAENSGTNRRDLPPAKWLFGQYNKFLPVKAACRALLNLLLKQPAGVPLSEALETISNAAWELGDYLYTQDLRAKRSREDALTAAFPTSASSGAVSRIRFANQFIGDLRQPKQAQGQPKETKFNGFPAALKFLLCSDGKPPALELTTAGAEFALLRNPIFDGSQDPAGSKFSEAEIEFLLAHIAKSVPEETFAYISIIDAVKHGANTPDQVDDFLCKRFDLRVMAKAEKINGITKTFLTTQRTGAISRMVDLGLLTRQKEGLRVTYLVSDKAVLFQSKIK